MMLNRMSNVVRSGGVASLSALAWTAGLHAADLVPSCKAGLEARRTACLELAVTRPYPKLGTTWGDLTQAIAALTLGRDIDGANTRVATVRERERSLDHWTLQQGHRLLLLFGVHGIRAPGRVRTDAEDAVLEATWDFVSERSRLPDADPGRTWQLVGSENHDIMYKTTYLFGSLLLSRDSRYADRTYAAGGTAKDHAEAWTRYFASYLRERGRKGLFVEVASPTYAKYTLTSIYNLHDFAPDPAVRDTARKLLDLYWADWAEDQLDGVRGGGKSRVYQGNYARRGRQEGVYAYQHLYFGFGEPSCHMASVAALTSAYRVPDVVLDIALDRVGRAVYTTLSRRPGDPGEGDASVEGVYNAAPKGRILRAGYHTPDYVLGCCMIDPRLTYTGISAQNRWQGMIFRGHPDARVFTFLGSKRKDKPQTYDAHVAVQHGPVLLLRGRPDAHKYHLDSYVYFADCLEERVEDGEWIFARHGDAYLGCRLPGRGQEWVTCESMPGPVIKLADARGIVVLHAGRRADDGTFEEFRAKLLGGQSTMADNAFHYVCPDGVRLTMFARDARLPEINGTPVDLTPDCVFDTPFIQSRWDSGVVTIRKGERELKLRFD